MKIAVCITTRNRPEAFSISLKNIKKYLPENARLFIVDDASDEDYAKADYRFTERAGIARAKNKCLELAMKWGAALPDAKARAGGCAPFIGLLFPEDRRL